LMYLDSRDQQRSVGVALASELRLPRAMNDRFLDTEPSREAIDARLAEIEQIAREGGAAVAMGHPIPVTFERLTMWIPSLPGKGARAAPAPPGAHPPGRPQMARPAGRGATDTPASLPYRPGVGMMLFNRDGQVFVGRRSDTAHAWQMPQGGIDDGESP